MEKERKLWRHDFNLPTISGKLETCRHRDADRFLSFPGSVREREKRIMGTDHDFNPLRSTVSRRFSLSTSAMVMRPLQAGLAGHDRRQATIDGHSNGIIGEVLLGDVPVKGGDVADCSRLVQVIDQPTRIMGRTAADEGLSAVTDLHVGAAQELTGGQGIVRSGGPVGVTAGVGPDQTVREFVGDAEHVVTIAMGIGTGQGEIPTAATGVLPRTHIMAWMGWIQALT